MKALEMVIAAAIAIVVGFAAVGAIGALGRSLASRASSAAGMLSLETELASMRADAATAYAVFVPARDVFGGANPANAAHEVDFYARTDNGGERWWAYRFDAGSSMLRRYDYQRTNGVTRTGVADRVTGAIDPAESYPAVAGVGGFVVRTLQADELAGHASAFGALFAGITAGGAGPAPLPVGFVPSDGTPRADLFGGNAIVEVRVTARDGERIVHLASAALPSGFTIHAKPSIREIVYRLDVMHRFWFGFAQKTWARIFEQLQYSYTPSVPLGWHVWCDFQLYGAGSDGLALDDRHATYQPQEWSEATAGAFYLSTQGNLSQLDPVGCGARIPGPTATPHPVPASTNPDVIDTPPPCFVQGLCWPNEAPVNWAPASPWPATSPPPAWCATHQLSTPCGGPGGTPLPVAAAPPPPTFFTPAPSAWSTDPPSHLPRPGGPVAL